MKRLKTITSLAAAGALLALPAAGHAHHRDGHTKGGDPGGTSKSCAKKATVDKGFVVKGTLVSYTADDSTTPGNEESVTITITGQNRHARLAALADSDAVAGGIQYRLEDDDDAFGVRLSGFEAGESPAAGDKVRIVGKVAVTRKKCAAPGTKLDDRYGDVNVRRVKIVDSTD